MLETAAVATSAVEANRWFIAIKRKDNSLAFASKSQRNFPTQASLLTAMEMCPGDIVLELFQSSRLDPRDFHSYCRDAYKHLLPKKDKVVLKPKEHIVAPPTT